MNRKNKFRKAADGGNLIIVGVAVGILIVMGLYMMSQKMMTSNATTQSSIGNALAGGIEELKK